MLDRLWWFVTGAIAGGFVTIRALRQSPSVVDIRKAAVGTGADALNIAAKVVRPNRAKESAAAR